MVKESRGALELTIIPKQRAESLESLEKDIRQNQKALAWEKAALIASNEYINNLELIEWSEFVGDAHGI